MTTAPRITSEAACAFGGDAVQRIDDLAAIAGRFDAIVLDQYGVLHDGARPYPGAVAALMALREAGHRLAVLSNSGKRAAYNAARIERMGFPPGLFEAVTTSGEALRADLARGAVPYRRLWPVEGAAGDAFAFADGLDVTLVDGPEAAEAVLLMGLPEGTDAAGAEALGARMAGLPVICSNPDRASPRAGGGTAVSPGALAHAHAAAGGEVLWYGKPHRAIFEAAARALGSDRLLMVGDSPEHDIAGGAGAGWATCLVMGGLHAARLAGDPARVPALMEAEGAPMPTYAIRALAGAA